MELSEKELLFLLGDEIFGDSNKFEQWLHCSNIALGRVKPVDLLNTAEGIHEVITLLHRIEHGIFS